MIACPSPLQPTDERPPRVLTVVDRSPVWDRWVVSARVREAWTLVGVFTGWDDACAAAREARARLGEASTGAGGGWWARRDSNP